jgi:hypothetical protein
LNDTQRIDPEIPYAKTSAQNHDRLILGWQTIDVYTIAATYEVLHRGGHRTLLNGRQGPPAMTQGNIL